MVVQTIGTDWTPTHSRMSKVLQQFDATDLLPSLLNGVGGCPRMIVVLKLRSRTRAHPTAALHTRDPTHLHGPARSAGSIRSPRPSTSHREWHSRRSLP